MRNTILILFLALVPTTARAAVGTHQWSSGWSAGGFACPDKSGHIAMAGTFFGSLDLGGGVFNPVNFLGGDVYVARFDDAGNHVWSTQYTPGGFGFILNAMCAAPDGSIYLAGTLQNGDINFGGGILSGNGVTVLAAFEPDGTHRWSFLLGAGTVRDLDASDTALAITGYTSGSVDFGGGLLTSAGDTDIIVAALAPDGTHVFSKIVGDASGQGGMTVAIDNSDGVVVAGTTASTIDLGDGPLAVVTNALFIGAYNALGTHSWSAVYEGDYSPGSGILADLDLDVSGAGNVALGGQFLGTVNLGGSDLTASGASADVFIALYDGNGVLLSSDAFGGTATDTAQGVSFDSNDNLAIAGTYLSPSIDFGAGPLTHAGGFGSDFFIAIFDASGSNSYEATYTGSGQYYIRPGFTAGNNLLLSGNGSGGTDFGGGPLTTTEVFLASFEGAGGTVVAAPSAVRKVFLAQNAPNPFNPSTTIRFEVVQDGPVRLDVFDLAGRRVRTLLNEFATAGEYSALFNGLDKNGQVLASGVYTYQLRTRAQSMTRRMVLVK